MNENELPRHRIVAAFIFMPSFLIGFFASGIFGVIPYHMGISSPLATLWVTFASLVLAVSLLVRVTLNEFVSNIWKGVIKLPKIRSFFFLGLCSGMVLFCLVLFLVITIGESAPPQSTVGTILPPGSVREQSDPPKLPFSSDFDHIFLAATGWSPTFVNQNRTTALYGIAMLSIVAIAACIAAQRIGRMPFVITTSFLGAVFGAIVVSVSLRLCLHGPWYAYTMLGILGGLLGLSIGRYIPAYFVDPPTNFMSNFEYNRLYTRHLFLYRLLLAFAVIGGGAIGFVASLLPKAVDEPSDARKSPIGREFES